MLVCLDRCNPNLTAQLDSIQNRADCVIVLLKSEYEDHHIQPLSHRKAIGEATFFMLSST